jgi:hypothetical protein
MAERGEPFVVFLFGMRWNRLSGLPRYVWGLRVVRRVLADLKARREPGFLAGHVYLAGRTLIAAQYWESFDQLDAYARDHALPHRRAWQRYLREALEDPAMGLWHETYVVEPGGWEGVYVNMPAWGLGAGAALHEMRATKGSARDRLHQRHRRSAEPPGPPEPAGPPGSAGPGA